MVNLVLRIYMCDVICRSVVSSGGLFEHGDELPDFTKAGKLFVSSLITNCLPEIFFRRWKTHELWISGRGNRFYSFPRGSDQRCNSSSLYSIVIWGFFRWGLSGHSVKLTTDFQKVSMSKMHGSRHQFPRAPSWRHRDKFTVYCLRLFQEENRKHHFFFRLLVHLLFKKPNTSNRFCCLYL
jgi:hypothetical protein